MLISMQNLLGKKLQVYKDLDTRSDCSKQLPNFFWHCKDLMMFRRREWWLKMKIISRGQLFFSFHGGDHWCSFSWILISCAKFLGTNCTQQKSLICIWWLFIQQPKMLVLVTWYLGVTIYIRLGTEDDALLNSHISYLFFKESCRSRQILIKIVLWSIFEVALQVK